MITLATILSIILIIIGFIAIMLPFLPSIPSVWFGIFLYAISHHFQPVTREIMVAISLIAAGSMFLDYTLSRRGVKKLRVGVGGVFGAVIGGLAGSFFGPVFMYVIGPVVGAIALEMLRGRDRIYSYKQGETTIVAFFGNTVIQLLAALLMTGLFVLKLQGGA